MKPQRQLRDHILAGLNDAISIFVLDEPGPGGANHHYMVSAEPAPGCDDHECITSEIKFQNGPIGEAGINGISNEALLAVILDRVRGFQYGRNSEGEFNPNCPGKYACAENARALLFLECALDALQLRTRARLARGVEGTHKV